MKKLVDEKLVLYVRQVQEQCREVGKQTPVLVLLGLVQYIIIVMWLIQPIKSTLAIFDLLTEINEARADVESAAVAYVLATGTAENASDDIVVAIQNLD